MILTETRMILPPHHSFPIYHSLKICLIQDGDCTKSIKRLIVNLGRMQVDFSDPKIRQTSDDRRREAGYHMSLQK